MKYQSLALHSLRAPVVWWALSIALCACGSDSPEPGWPGGSSDADAQATSDDDESQKPAGPESSSSKGPGGNDAGPKLDAGAAKEAGAATTKGNEAVPCDVAAILAKNCATCHGAETAFGAPMSLVTLADFRAKTAQGAAMVEAVRGRINETNPKLAMPPSTGIKLTSAELSTLNKWLDGGAKGATGVCEDTPSSMGGAPDAGNVVDPDSLSEEGLDCYKLTAFGNGKNGMYKVGTAVDKYVNFTFKAPWPATAYGVRYVPIISNTKALHHFLLFQDSGMKAAGSSNSSGAHPDGQLLYGWAPGGQTLDFREGNHHSVGFEMSGNTSYTVEMHYNSNDPNAEDGSGMKICVARSKPENIAGLTWLGYDQLVLPAAKWTGQCVPENKVPVRILGVQPHMHVAGRHMKTVIHRKGGGDEVLHDEPFDFNDQRHYLKDVTIMPGDTLTTECTYDKPMAFGESTGQEMCYNFTVAYPKGQLKDSGLWGSTAHGGSACLGQ